MTGTHRQPQTWMLKMKLWRRPSLAMFSLLALLLTWLPQIVWSCPMTGRIGAASQVCRFSQSSPVSASQHCERKANKANSQQKTRGCCLKAKAPTPPTHSGCANPGGDCCKLVRLPGSPHTTTPPSVERTTVHHQVALLVAPVMPVIASALLAAQMNAPIAPATHAASAELPLQTQHLSPVLLGRAPPRS